MKTDKQTIEVYDRKCTDYRDMLTDIHPEKTLLYFENLLPKCADVLDYGCGPGISTKFFADQGHNVNAFDASPKMVELIPTHPKINAKVASFDDFKDINKFDGIWASFSLLHAPKSDFVRLISAIHQGLKPNGIFAIGLKLGIDEHRDKLGRHYSYYTQTELETLLTNSNFHIFHTSTGNAIGLDGTSSPWIFMCANA